MPGSLFTAERPGRGDKGSQEYVLGLVDTTLVSAAGAGTFCVFISVQKKPNAEPVVIVIPVRAADKQPSPEARCT